MKITKLVFAFLLLIVLAEPSTTTTPNERLWISFVSNRSFAKYIMQIDVLGNVVLPPVRVSELGTFRRAGVNALSLNGTRALNLWYAPVKVEKRNISFLGQLFRLVVDKDTLKTVRLVKTSLHQIGGIMGIGSPIDVTKRTRNNFISFVIKKNEGMRVVAYPLNEFGQVIGRRWFASPPLSQSCDDSTIDCKGGTTANGRLAWWMVKDPANFFRTDLFIRPLGALGRSVMETIKIDSIVAQSSGFWIFQAADATGILPGNRRFLVYIKAPSPDAGFSQKLLLQPIDARTGKKIGDRIVLHSAFQLSVVKIDPAGRFVLFTDDGLLYLALDAAGHASGRSKVLTDLDVGPIDLLRETVK